jgi:hypothetical protein
MLLQKYVPQIVMPFRTVDIAGVAVPVPWQSVRPRALKPCRPGGQIYNCTVAHCSYDEYACGRGAILAAISKVRRSYRIVRMIWTAARLVLCCAIALATPLLGSRAAESGAEPSQLKWQDRQASVAVEPSVGELRRYEFTAGSDSGASTTRQIAEAPDQPYLRTGNIMFDGLFAMAVDDSKLDSVSQIQDAVFNNGEPIACDCFETGERWNYVWTRDISYSADLGLGYLDPRRVLNSLFFKTSDVRPELLGTRIKPVTVVAQDTGSGGSWPVSTDRVVWIMAASDELDQLPEKDRAALAPKIYGIARDTLEQDHEYAFDGRIGLYRGETSFLDWREQSYPRWTRSDVLYIAEGYAFSTNVLHIIALERTAALAEQLRDPAAARYRQWAQQLRRTVNARFWQEPAGMYASYLGPAPGATPSASYDLLGLALAIIHGVADSRQAQLILERYPMTEAGPPVIFPELAGIPIYHNRALWPFVTAYALRAAKVGNDAEFAAESARSLIRGAALSLSNMENYEFLTQRTHFDDGLLSGPVINSPRQLWSVAGYLNMVLESFWGLQPGVDRLVISPGIPANLAVELFTGQRRLTLHHLHYADTTLDITLVLPESQSSQGWLMAADTSLNGLSVPGNEIRRSSLKVGQINEIEIHLRAVAAPALTISRVPSADPWKLTPAQFRQIFSPRIPTIVSATDQGSAVDLKWRAGEPDGPVQIFRNGRKIAEAATGTSFRDPVPLEGGTACYSLSGGYAAIGLTSLPSRENCVSPTGLSSSIAAAAMRLTPATEDSKTGRGSVEQFPDWGAPEQALQFEYTPPVSGMQRLKLRYANAHGPINTGITAAVKAVTAQCGRRAQLQSGPIVMPQLATARAWGLSTGFFFDAERGEPCTLRIVDGFNMSYLKHFELYTGGQGGKSGALNRASIAGAELDVFHE